MIVLDASALLAFVQREPGGLKVKAALHNCVIPAVNFTEVLNRLQKTLGGQNAAGPATGVGQISTRNTASPSFDNMHLL
jgi:PIN domain nuclease of toxin-antitoxin system